MYATIFQMTETRLSKPEWIKESDFFDTAFIHTIADRVENCKNKTEQTQRLDQWLQNFGLGSIKNEVLVLHPHKMHSRYFTERYAEFKRAAENLAAVSLETYLSDFNGIMDLMYDVRKNVENKFGDYVYREADSLITMDEFLHTAEAGRSYYIGGVCVYHC